MSTEQYFEDDIDMGIDIWGKYVVAAYEECFPEDGEEDDDEESETRVNMKCDDAQVWVDALEALADRILWDRDFELYNQILRAPDELLPLMRISPTYYSRTHFPNARGAKRRLYMLTDRIANLPQAEATTAVALTDHRNDSRRPIQKESPKKRKKK
jgi:hypothetical protein